MRREIVINGRFLSRRITGVERHGREILPFIGDRCRLETTRMNGLQGHLWEQFMLPRRLSPGSLLWSPANTGPLSVDNQALTIHDLSVLEHPQWFRKSFALWYALFVPLLIKRVKVLFVPSEYVKQKISRQFGLENVVVTPNGVNLSVFHPGAKQKRYQLPSRYILFVGTLEPRKNLWTLLKAWIQIQSEFQDVWLVIAGTYGGVHASPDLAANVERVLFLGYADEDALPGLYANAMLLVLPSLDEGFGLPALEAMACGTPTVISNKGALPEVTQDAGLVFEPSDRTALVTALCRCMRESELREWLREKGLARAREFSWRTTSDLIWDVLDGI